MDMEFLFRSEESVLELAVMIVNILKTIEVCSLEG